MLSKELENTLNETFRMARARRHEFITVEHLLLALLDDAAATAVLTACQVNMDEVRGELRGMGLHRHVCRVCRVFVFVARSSP